MSTTEAWLSGSWQSSWMASEFTTAIFRDGKGSTLWAPMNPRNGGVKGSWPTILGTRDVADVENDQACFAVGDIDARPFDVRRPVNRDVAVRRFTPGRVLARHPPSAGFDGIGRVADVHDDVGIAVVARHPRRLIAV